MDSARTIIMSLWKVNDEATRKLMTDFYFNWLKTRNKRESFRRVQRNMKREYGHPYFWGAFIMVGE